MRYCPKSGWKNWKKFVVNERIFNQATAGLKLVFDVFCIPLMRFEWLFEVASKLHRRKKCNPLDTETSIERA